MNSPPDERMFAVAVRDGEELFLRVRIRRAARGGDIYYSLPTGRSAPEWKKWDPHGSYHKDGRSHHKSFDRKALVRQSQKPDFGFKGWWPFIVILAGRNDAQAFGTICDPTKFAEVMEIPATVLSAENKTHISIDLTEPGVEPSMAIRGAEVIAEQTFRDSIPWILVRLMRAPARSG